MTIFLRPLLKDDVGEPVDEDERAKRQCDDGGEVVFACKLQNDDSYSRAERVDSERERLCPSYDCYVALVRFRDLFCADRFGIFGDSKIACNAQNAHCGESRTEGEQYRIFFV